MSGRRRSRRGMPRCSKFSRGGLWHFFPHGSRNRHFHNHILRRKKKVLAAAWNADTQLNAREPRGGTKNPRAEIRQLAAMTSRCVGSQTWPAGVAPGPRVKSCNRIELPMLVLHHAWRSSASRRVRLCLAEKGLAFQSHLVDMMSMEHHSPEYLKINPQRRHPDPDPGRTAARSTRAARSASISTRPIPIRRCGPPIPTSAP